jgi:hypothetical protein
VQQQPANQQDLHQRALLKISPLLHFHRVPGVPRRTPELWQLPLRKVHTRSSEENSRIPQLVLRSHGTNIKQLHRSHPESQKTLPLRILPRRTYCGPRGTLLFDGRCHLPQEKCSGHHWQASPRAVQTPRRDRARGGKPLAGAAGDFPERKRPPAQGVRIHQGLDLRFRTRTAPFPQSH